ncbi:MAG: SusC/RagA family TonB-linked outer membrane protein [Flavisolibacter sp.]
MRKLNLIKPTTFVVTLLLFSLSQIFAQTTPVTGTVTDQTAKGVAGVTVSVKGTSTATQTDANGNYRISVPDHGVLVFSSVGYGMMEISVNGRSTVDATLTSSNNSLSEVVVIGYGSVRRRDVTGAVATVQPKDFNKGPITNPDQLLIGKVSGLQIINSSGQPGAATIVKIRGNNSIRSGNTPLYVVDGIPLDGRSARPTVSPSGVGTTPDVNPLLFINPNDIASIDILKDASASAIYGSRGANGVILVTTKKGTAGQARVDVNASAGVSNVMRNVDVLDAAGYRSALKTYNAPVSDSGANVNPFDEILHKNAPTQNYSVAFGGGSANGRYHASFLYADQNGVIRKSDLKKYVGSFNGQYKFLDNKLSFDFNVIAANVNEHIAPISNDAGSTGNIISLALIWNPTLSLTGKNGLYNQTNPSGQVNPLAMSDAYNDIANTTTILGSVAVGYKITNDLEYRMLLGLDYSTGIRQQEMQGWIKATGGNADGKGEGAVLNNRLFSRILTHTLNYNKQITQAVSLNALVGYEYSNYAYEGVGTGTYQFSLNLNQANINPNYHYYNDLGAGNQANLQTFGFKDPSVELQSYFARAVLNLRDRYLLTATIRSDGSSKFGANNKYATFPSVAGAWVISNENFLKNSTLFNSLKLRVGYGQTGNQTFNPVDAALDAAHYTGVNQSTIVHYGNPDLRWETVSSVDAGIDFSLLKGKFWGFVDYFDKKTINPIVDFPVSQPTAGGTLYKNMDGETHPTVGYTPKAWVTNKGVEASVGVAIIEKKDFVWNFQGNITFVQNRFESPELAALPFVKNTGGLHGQGSSGAYAEVIANGQPLDVFYLPEFLGFDKASGIAQYSKSPIYAGDPNPDFYYGFSTDATFKKVSLGLNFHGNHGNKIFNNTAMSVLNISNIVGGRNIASGLVGNGENVANAITPSTRFLENGSFLKLGNATLTYRFGDLGKYLKNFSVYISGNNLFVISDYKGFDPEVNIDKTLNGIPSLGIDYIGFPTARTFLLGVNFSLQ